LRAALPIWKRTHAAVDEQLSETDLETVRAGLHQLA
jgi:hypothetical protein